MKIALAQFEVISGHPKDNANEMLELIRKAKETKIDLIIFSELCISGYLIGDTWEEKSFLKECEECGKKIIESSEGICIIFGNIASDYDKKNNDGRVRKYNAFFTAYNKKLCFNSDMPYPFTIKTLLPNYREFEDSRHFYSYKDLAFENNKSLSEYLKPIEININGENIKIGCVICEDAWSDDYSFSPMDIIDKNGDVDLFVNISCSPYTIFKNDKRHRLFSKKALELKTPIIYVNNIGIQNNGKTVYTFDGSSTAYDSGGDIAGFCEAYKESLYSIDFDLKNKKFNSKAQIEKEEETASIYKTLSYGIEKFLRAIDMKRVVIGVSGGIDSALSASIYSSVLGSENVLLVNMPSKYNSNTTKNLAKTLSENLGCKYMVIPIEHSLEHTIDQIENTEVTDFLENKNNYFKLSPIALENIQARDRSSRILSALSSCFQGGFTCNANKTETTVGYSTLYGDGAGFFAAFADLWKYQIYNLARYVNEKVYKREVIPEGTINVVPSAELSNEQAVDEGKGDPIKYPYHDFLFKIFVESWNKVTPEDILLWYSENTLEKNIGCEKGVVKKFFKSDREFIDDLERWWRLFKGMAVAKRIQAPPILAISPRAYGYDYRESQNGVYYTEKYLSLKNKILSKP